MERFHELIRYDPATGHFYWIALPPCQNTRAKKREIGSRADIAHQEGVHTYRVINLFGRQWRAHRLAWWYVHGVYPAALVDHKNNDPADNRIDNLRLATEAQNSRNTKLSKTNTSGYKGVYWCSYRNRWRAAITINSKPVQLGRFKTPEEAHAAYCAAAARLHGEFANSGIGLINQSV